MRGSSAKATLLSSALLCACAVGVGSARAHDAGGATPVATLHIDVRARIVARCGFAEAPHAPGKAADINTAERLEVPFKLDCNTPFVIGVKSDHGALATDRTSDSSGFALSKAYKVELLVGTDGSPLSPEACWSDQLTATPKSPEPCAFFGDKPNQGLSSDKLISTGKPSSLTVSWPGADAAGPRNAAGAYHDIITITVTART